MTLRRLFLVFSSVALLTCLDGPARAQPKPTPAGDATLDTAKQAYDAGVALFDAKDFEGALAKFRQALDASGSPNARLYVGRCLIALSRPVEAYEEMAKTARDAAARAESEPKYAQTRDAAAAELVLLEPKIGKLVIALADAPADAAVTLDGAPVEASRIGAPIAVTPGNRVVEVTTPSGTKERREIMIGGGETKTIAVSFPKTQSGPTPPPIKPDEPRGGAVRTLGFVTVGLGVAGMVVFGVTGAMSNNKFKTLEDECGSQRCTDPKYADVVDSGKTLELVANIGLIGGIVGLVGGGAMILFGGPSEPAPGASVAISTHGGMLQYQGAF
jgi:hypothetical protein